jgi:hypothetical protein
VEVERSPDPQAAYLGPRLWEKPISLQQFNEDDFFVMNIDEFLTENNLSMESKEGLSHPLKVFFFTLEPVLRIHDILVWIRICGSMPLTNGSGSFYFHH